MGKEIGKKKNMERIILQSNWIMSKFSRFSSVDHGKPMFETITYDGIFPVMTPRCVMGRLCQERARYGEVLM